MALGPLRFEAEVAFARVALADAGDDLAVDGQGDPAVFGLDAVMVPFVGPLAAVLAGQAALPALGVRPIRHAVGPQMLNRSPWLV